MVFNTPQPTSTNPISEDVKERIIPARGKRATGKGRQELQAPQANRIRSRFASKMDMMDIDIGDYKRSSATQIGPILAAWARKERGLCTRSSQQTMLTYPGTFGLEFDEDAPLNLAKLPVEIVLHIVGFLEPVWMVQFARAFPEIDAMLSYEESNRMWFDALPPALLLEEEHFQDDMEIHYMVHFVKDVEENRFDIAKMASNPYVLEAMASRRQAPAVNRVLDSEPIPDGVGLETFAWSKVGVPQTSFYPDPGRRLPYVVGPSDPRQLPRISLLTGRTQVLAIGTVYNPVLNYKREILGHMHARIRCWVCFENTSLHGNEKQFPKRYDLQPMIMCEGCYSSHYTNAYDIHRVPELDEYLTVIQDFTWNSKSLRYRAEDATLWFNRHMVEALLRKRAMMTLNRVLHTVDEWNDFSLRHSIESWRRVIRQKIILAAKKLWDGEDYKAETDIDLKTGRKIVKPRKLVIDFEWIRNAWAPTEKLGDFLFPRRALESAFVESPGDYDKNWPADPVSVIFNTYHAARIDDAWVNSAAEEMLKHLTYTMENPPRGIADQYTLWAEAADEWHLKQLRHRVRHGELVKWGLGGDERIAPPRLVYVRKRVGLQSLDEDITPPGLAAKEKELLTESFYALLEKSCTGCPHSGYLLGQRRGFRSLIEHMRESHPTEYFTPEPSFLTVG